MNVKKISLNLIFAIFLTFVLLIFSQAGKSKAYFQTIIDYSSPSGKIAALTAADFDGDTRGEISFLSGDLKTRVVDEGGDLIYESNPLPGNFPVDLGLVDASGDGLYDVISVTDSGLSVHDIRAQDSEPIYQVISSGFSFTANVETGDINGDFSPEIIAGAYLNSQNQSRLVVYDSFSGSLRATSGYFSGEIQDISVDDIDGDGVDDLIAASDSGRVYAFFGGSDSRLTTAALFNEPDGRAVSKVAAVQDMTGGGLKEIAFGTNARMPGVSERVGIIETESGNLLTDFVQNKGGEIVSLVTYDLNFDGKIEIITGSGVYQNSPNSTKDDFSLRIYSSENPMHKLADSNKLTAEVYVRAGDFDGDGLSEIAASHGNAINLYYLSGSSLVLEETTSTFSQALESDFSYDAKRINLDYISDLVRGGVSGEIKAVSFYRHVPPPEPEIVISNDWTSETVEAGSQNFVIDRINIYPEAECTLTALKFNYLGNLEEKNIYDLRLYRDNGSGYLDDSDTLLATTKIDSSTAIFSLNLPFSGSTTETLLLVGNIDSDAPKGSNFTFSIESTESVVAYPLQVKSVLPLFSIQHQIVDKTAPEMVYEQISEPTGNNGWYTDSALINLFSDEPGVIYYWFGRSEPEVYSGTINPPSGIHELNYYAIDLYGNRSATKTLLIKKDVKPPEAPSGLKAEPGTEGSVEIDWRPSLDKEPGSGLFSYKIYRNGVHIGTVQSSKTNYVDLGVKPLTKYSYRVSAVDTAGNESPKSKTKVVRTPRKDIELPTVHIISRRDRNVLTWSRTSTGPVAGIVIERSAPNSGNGGWKDINSTPLPPDSTFYEDILPPNMVGNDYFYRLVFYDSNNNILAKTRPYKSERVSLSKIIGPSGDRIESSNGEIKINFVENSLSSEETITIETTSTTLPTGVKPLSSMYRLGPDGITFANSATLTISFSGPESMDKELVKVATYDGESWNFLETKVDIKNGLAVARVNHFSVYGVYFMGSEVDTTPPVINAARSASPSKLFITFSEFIDSTSVAEATYEVSETTVTSATLFSDGKSVILTTDYLIPESEHTVTVRGIKDLAGNTIQDDGVSNVATFTVATPPHGKYLDDTNKCSLCHRVHLAKNQKLLVKKTTEEVCYICHDEIGSGSKYTTKSDYESTTAAAIHYPRLDEERPYCADCHSPHKDSVNVPRLLRVKGKESSETTNLAESFCFACHGSNGAFPDYLKVSESSYTTSAHYSYLPGPSSGTGITCIHCHENHSSSEDTLIRGSTEEFICISCHRENGSSPESGASISAPDIYSSLLNSPDSTEGLPGFESTKTVWYRHPVMDYYGRHTLMELFDSTEAITLQETTSTRHAECEDCHNSHVAKQTSSREPALIPESLMGASGVEVTYTAGTTVPSFTFIPYNFGIRYEYQLCFKCHSSFANATEDDNIAQLSSPNNGSYHPVLDKGTNDTPEMANNLISGLTVNSQIYCSSCHFTSDPTLPRGPHGSVYPFILGGNYLFELKETTSSDDYSSEQFSLCFKCHSSQPFDDVSGVNRTDTNFSFHGYHMRLLYDNPQGNTVDGGILTPGAGKGNAICRECHYQLHGISSLRLVKFAPNVLGPGGETDGEVFQPRTAPGNGYCELTCHGKVHNSSMTY